MDGILLDEVKSKRADKYAKIFLICSIGLFLCFSFKILLNLDAQKGIGFAIDCLILLFSITSSYTNYKKVISRKKQFIQWWSNKISYKLFDDVSPKEIVLSDITSLSVGMDEIVIYTHNNHNHHLKIADFTDYVIRLRIKANFEKVRSERRLL